MPIKLGHVGHFGLPVKEVKRSKRWWIEKLNLKSLFDFPGGALVGNDAIMIGLHQGKPRPELFGHMSFHLPSMAALRSALIELRRKKVDLEDPGDEIGPTSKGSKNMGLWLHDLDGYRWELSVFPKPVRRKKK